MTQRKPTIDELILTIHSLPLHSAAWSHAMNGTRELVGADRAIVCLPAPSSAQDFWSVSVGFDREPLEAYANGMVEHDLWLQGSIAFGRIESGTVSLDDQLVDRRTFMRSVFYSDFSRKYDVDRFVGLCLTGPEKGTEVPRTVASFVRHLGTEAFGSEEATLLRRLAPHFSVAAKNFWHARSLDIQGAVHSTALDAVDVPLFVIDRRGDIAMCNRAADQVLRNRQWLSTQGGRLTPADRVLESRACATALQRLSRGFGTTLVLTDGSDHLQALLMTVPLAAAVIPDSVARGLGAGLVWLLPTRPNADAIATLAVVFGLTPAEKRLLKALVEEEDLRAVAAKLSVSVHTARNQLKSVLRKTSCRTQARVMGLVHRMSVCPGT